MGHHVYGFISEYGDLKLGAEALEGGIVCPLAQGFGFLPLCEPFLDKEDWTTSLEHIVHLTRGLEDWAIEQSRRYPLAYIETEYFGGIGEQMAVVWEHGEVAVGPLRTDDFPNAPNVAPRAINAALRRLGAEKVSIPAGTSWWGNVLRFIGKNIIAPDEFAAVGLHRFRSNEDWIEAAMQKPPPAN